ncbi:hypothetical protein JTB14_025866 [Gonioctena quinquepunctata]|nr:hypothetical protein JTB14_025866 [Gonioctena quinquepunctata]
MIKLALKVGIASAAVYYVKDQGVWKSSNESVKTYENLKELVDPYLQDIKSKIPIEFPELPERGKLSSLAKQSWNKGVMVTFEFLSVLPQTANKFVNTGVDHTMQNPEIAKFIESFSNKK